MSIENDLSRIATALEGLLAHVTGTEPAKRGPGRPAKAKETVEAPPAGEAASSAAPAAAATASATTPSPAATTASAPATAADDELLAKCKARAKALLPKRDQLVAMLKKHGGESPSTLPAANRAAFLADTEELYAEVVAG